MTTYLQKIQSIPLFRSIEGTTTTGDLDYPGTALEIFNENGEELFEFVVDSSGEIFFVVNSRTQSYRITLDTLERIVKKAKEVAHLAP